MRLLYSALIYATVVLAIATVWAVGRDRQAASDLRRAQELAAVPQYGNELAAAALADAYPAAAPSTRPIPWADDDSIPSADATCSEP